MTATDILITDMLQRLEIVEELLTRERQLMMCSVYRSTDQTISTSTWTAASFSSAVYDPFSLWSGTNPTRITSISSGYYMAVGAARWELYNAGIHTNQLRIIKNGTSIYGRAAVVVPGGLLEPRMQVWSVIPIPLAAGDYIEMEAYHNVSGGSDILAEGGTGTYLTLWKVIS